MNSSLLLLSAAVVVSASAPTLRLSACSAADASQRFTLTAGTVQQGGLCVSFTGDYNAPLVLTACDGTTSQSWDYNASQSAFRNPLTACAGSGGACLEWSGQEAGACTSSPPALGIGCIIGSWPVASSGVSTWNDQLALDSPSPGMLQALHSAAGSTGDSGLCVSAVTPPTPPPTPMPTEDILRWSDAQVMCLYDFDLATFNPDISQGCLCSEPPPSADTWNPTALDTDSWIAAGVSAGCNIHILVAKHMCGFVTWASTSSQELGYNFSTAYSSTPVDAVAAFVASARKVDAKIGMYYSLTNNARTNTCAGKVLPNAAPGQISVTEEEYTAIVLTHLRELWGSYGVLEEVWMDGGFTPSLKAALPALLSELQPHAVGFQAETLLPSPTRWIGSESGYAPNDTWSACDFDSYGAGDPNAGTWFPSETDFTVLSGDTWFFSVGTPVRPPSQLRDMYEQSVGHNSQALIGIGIPPNGTLIGTEQAAALAALGSYVTGCFSQPVVSIANASSGSPITLMPSMPSPIDRVVVREDQRSGQLIRAWTLTLTLSDGSSLVAAQGQSIGNKRIIALPPGLSVALATLNVSAVAPTAVRLFALYAGCGALAAEMDAGGR